MDQVRNDLSSRAMTDVESHCVHSDSRPSSVHSRDRSTRGQKRGADGNRCAKLNNHPVSVEAMRDKLPDQRRETQDDGADRKDDLHGLMLGEGSDNLERPTSALAKRFRRCSGRRQQDRLEWSTRLLCLGVPTAP